MGMTDVSLTSWPAGQAVGGRGLSVAFEEEQREQLARRSGQLQEQGRGRGGAPAQGLSPGWVGGPPCFPSEL